jgi:hypothetical protein
MEEAVHLMDGAQLIRTTRKASLCNSHSCSYRVRTRYQGEIRYNNKALQAPSTVAFAFANVPL